MNKVDNFKGIKLPERGRVYDIYSFLLYKELRGNITYRNRLNRYALNVYEIGNKKSNQFNAKNIKSKNDIIKCLELIFHTISHIASIPYKYRYVSISLRKSEYSKQESHFYGLSYLAMYKAVNMLKNSILSGNQSYILLIKGTFDRKKNSGLMSRIQPTEALLDDLLQNNLIFPGHPKGLKTNKYRPNNSLGLIQVKKTDQNKDSQYILNLDRSLQENEKIIPILNKRYKTIKMDFKIPNYQVYLDTWNYYENKSKLTNINGKKLFRRFTDNDCDGGRLYGHWVQNCPNLLRKYLTMNNLPVIEKDFSSMNLLMLYGLAKKTPPNGDLYMITAFPEDREWMKTVLTKSIGAKNKVEVIGSLRKEMFKIRRILLMEAEKMFEKFWEKHHQVYHLLFKDKIWKKLQYIESNIALKILSTLYEKNIIAIPIHDSFIVQKRYEKELFNAMYNSFKKYFPDIDPSIK